MIEISDEKYWKRLNYHDGLLYCQLLDIDDKNDWRMVTDVNEVRVCRYNNVDVGTRAIWHCHNIHDSTDNFLNLSFLWVIPVRDA